MGVPPSGPGHSATPEPVVSALRASVPNAEAYHTMIYPICDWYGRPVGLTKDPFYRDPMWASCGAAIERGKRAAQGIEAGTATTEGRGPKDEGPSSEGGAPNA